MGKTGCLVIAGAVLLIAVLMGGVWLMSGYNGLVALDETVAEAWSQVDNQYQRRLELIPNLVETVRGAAAFEQETFTRVAEARAEAGRVEMSAEQLDDPAALARFERAQGALSSALARLLVTVERYPELKANRNFLALQDELAGTENRIAVERRRFNEVVQRYNTRVRTVPSAFIANLFGFEPKAYFEAREGAETAPAVEF